MRKFGPRFITTTTAMYDDMSFGNESLADKVPLEMLDLVDIHWYQFPPLNPIWHKMLILFLVVATILASIGNGLVLWIFTSTKNLRSPSNLLVVNLAFSDFCMMLSQCPPMIINCFYETWVLGPLGCDLYGVTGSLFGNVSIWTMVIIALDRYNVIVKGLAAKPLTNRTATIRLAIVWGHAFLWTMFPIFGWNKYVPEGNMTSCGIDFLEKKWSTRSYILIYSSLVYFTPLLTIIYAYTHIVKAVAIHEQNMRDQAKKMNVVSLRSGDVKAKNAEIKLAKVALVTIACWFMSWTPYLIINYTGIFEVFTLTPLFTIWGSVFAKAVACYNPIVYAISHPKYRAALKKKAPMFLCGDVEGSETSSVASGVTVSSSNSEVSQ